MSRHHQRWYHAFRWGDLVIAAAILFLAAGLFAYAGLAGKTDAVQVVLLHEGRLIRSWDQDALAREGAQELTIAGYHYRLEWGQGQIRFAEADCPDRVCVQSGWVGKRGSIAACVPAGLILKVTGNLPDPGGSDDVDLVIR
ncbi:MAG: NusG domain II-containing protein [Saccharofermentanales bacterium]|jgi:hypothetical protein